MPGQSIARDVVGEPRRSAEDARLVAVVTGASSGIGEATARLLAGRGWHCVLVARREDRLRALAGEIGADVVVCDVGERDAVAEATARILERHPVVDLLVNNAGIPARSPFDTVELDLVERVARVNYLGGVWTSRGLLPGLVAAAEDGRRAHVVNVVSIAGAVAFAPSGAYIASKHAQLAFSRSLRVTLRPRRIAVHTILPGYVATEGFPQRALLESRWLRRIVAQPDDVARAIVRAVERGRHEVVVPWFPYRLALVLYGLAPVLLGRLGDRAVRRSRTFAAKAAEGDGGAS